MDGPALLAKAKKEEESVSTFDLRYRFNKTARLKQAIKTYAQAANTFREVGHVTDAGAAFEKAAELSEQINKPNDASNYYMEASKVYRDTMLTDAARCASKGTEIYLVTNVLLTGADKQRFAEMFEREPSGKPRAVKEYDNAGDWFRINKDEASAVKCYIRAADIAAEIGDYKKAIRRYEEIAGAAAADNSRKHSVKDYLFKATLCRLASKDIVATKSALQEEYTSLYSSFAVPAVQAKFLNDLFECVENREPQQFSKNVTQYKERYPLDQLKLGILGKIQQSIGEEASDELM